MRRLLRWKILLPAIAVSFLVLSMTQALERGASRPAIPTVPPDASDEQALRLQAAERAAESFLADPTDLQRTRRVLISFEHGMSLPDALRTFEQAAGDSKLESIDFSILDEAGTRHRITHLVDEGEDPEVEAQRAVSTLVEAAREGAREQLGLAGSGDVGGGESEDANCLKVEKEKTCAHLVAESHITEEQALVYGLTAKMSGKDLVGLLRRRQDLGILAVEFIEREGFFPSPIIIEGDQE